MLEEKGLRNVGVEGGNLQVQSRKSLRTRLRTRGYSWTKTDHGWPTLPCTLLPVVGALITPIGKGPWGKFSELSFTNDPAESTDRQ